jgi:hypothetical protein
MNADEQRRVLDQLTLDIGRRAGCQVVAEPYNGQRGFRLKIDASYGAKKSVFGYATIMSRVECLSTITWEKFFDAEERARMPHWEPRSKKLVGNEDGLRFRYCAEDSRLYQEMVCGLTLACRWCLVR